MPAATPLAATPSCASLEQRKGAILERLLKPVQRNWNPPRHLERDAEAQRQALADMGETALSLLPTDWRLEAVELALSGAKKRLLREHHLTSWPKPAAVADALEAEVLRVRGQHRSALRDGPSDGQGDSPAVSASHDAKVDEPAVRAWMGEQDVRSLRLNAKHYRRRSMSAIGTASDHRMAELLEAALLEAELAARKAHAAGAEGEMP